MRIEYGNIKVGVEEVFFYNPNETVMNICYMCSRKNCPVPDKDIVNNCNSYKFIEKPQSNPIATDWRIIQEITVSNEHHAYMSNCAS